MSNSIIILGQNESARKNKIESIAGISIHKGHPDLLVIKQESDKKSIGIGQIRNGIAFLNEKPYSRKNKVLLIQDANNMTTQAQNALLKTLEEPPVHADIILEAKTEKGLLETVKSRCRKIRAETTLDELNIGKVDEIPDVDSTLLPSDRGMALYRTSILSKEDTETIIKVLEFWIRQYREKLRQKGNLKYVTNIELITSAIEDLEDTNINKQILLDLLALELK
ncbi:hypothetical protein JXA34_03075 [Patescibacteria group bacterium]|nr:hypothetical protein [Patescibacteria group bacterium]